jgi:NADPH-dependent 2,4-dienoyl-CoA reductase/sulfur reductase-like enzyme/rhodanese-related sulfurtransferase
MKVVIIGAVAGGATAAARLRRLNEEAKIIIFDRGPHVSFANCGLPYFVGGEIASSKDLLLHTPESLASRFKLQLHVNTEVIAIDRKAKEVLFKNRLNGQEGRQAYDKLIISTGAAPIRPNVPGIDSSRIFTVRDVPDVEKIKAFIETKAVKSAVVIGGGFIGVEMLEQLNNLKLKLALVQGIAHVLGPIDSEMAELLHQEIRKNDVDLILADPLVGFEESQTEITVELKSGKKLATDLVILAIGVKPESKLAQEAGLTVGTKSGIIVDDFLCTTDPDIYAIGDAIEVKELVFGKAAQIALAGPANRQARIAADNICGKAVKYKGTLGTAIIRVFDLTVASTGLSEEYLKAHKIDFQKIYLHPANRVTYYPGASTLSIKLLFNKEAKILGAQIVGKEGVDKRIDVLATAIMAGLNVVDLKNLELAYAPPYGAAKDPINLAGMMAENVLSGFYEQVFANDLPQDAFYVDVRNSAELKQGALPNAVHIPLQELRSRLSELPKDKQIVVYCQSGQRSYFASRILIQNGFKVKNLSGAFKTYCQFQNKCG